MFTAGWVGVAGVDITGVTDIMAAVDFTVATRLAGTADSAADARSAAADARSAAVDTRLVAADTRSAAVGTPSAAEDTSAADTVADAAKLPRRAGQGKSMPHQLNGGAFCPAEGSSLAGHNGLA